MRRFVPFLILAVLTPGCAGLRLRGDVALEKSRREVVTAHKGRVTINVRVIDVSGNPVSGSSVTLITDRNETVNRLTQNANSNASANDTGAAGVDPSQTVGTAQFLGLRGPVKTIEVWVSGRATTFSELDIEKGWDTENNIVNLVVRDWGSGLQSPRGMIREGDFDDHPTPKRSVFPASVLISSDVEPPPEPPTPVSMCWLNPGGDKYHHQGCQFIGVGAFSTSCSEAKKSRLACRTCGGW